MKITIDRQRPNVERYPDTPDTAGVSVLSDRRVRAPFGLHGGAPGANGEKILFRADGSRQDLNGHFQGTVEAGDRLEIRTPGGGGFGNVR